MACNAAMGTETDRAIIDALGGPAVVARKLGLNPRKGGVQRVSNWKKRGIPDSVRIARPDLFGLIIHPSALNGIPPEAA